MVKLTECDATSIKIGLPAEDNCFLWASLYSRVGKLSEEEIARLAEGRWSDNADAQVRSLNEGFETFGVFVWENSTEFTLTPTVLGPPKTWLDFTRIGNLQSVRLVNVFSRQLIFKVHNLRSVSARTSIRFLNAVWEREGLDNYVKVVDPVESMRFLQQFNNLRVGQKISGMERLSVLFRERGSYSTVVPSYIDEYVECATSRGIIGISEEPIIPKIKGPVAVRIYRGSLGLFTAVNNRCYEIIEGAPKELAVRERPMPEWELGNILEDVRGMFSDPRPIFGNLPLGFEQYLYMSGKESINFMSRLVASLGRTVSALHILECSEAEARSLTTKHILGATNALITVDYGGKIVKVGRKDSESIIINDALTSAPWEAVPILGKWFFRLFKERGTGRSCSHDIETFLQCLSNTRARDVLRLIFHLGLAASGKKPKAGGRDRTCFYKNAYAMSEASLDEPPSLDILKRCGIVESVNGFSVISHSPGALGKVVELKNGSITLIENRYAEKRFKDVAETLQKELVPIFLSTALPGNCITIVISKMVNSRVESEGEPEIRNFLEKIQGSIHLLLASRCERGYCKNISKLTGTSLSREECYCRFFKLSEGGPDELFHQMMKLEIFRQPQNSYDSGLPFDDEDYRPLENRAAH